MQNHIDQYSNCSEDIVSIEAVLCQRKVGEVQAFPFLGMVFFSR